ncbi:MAG TPA: glycosyltransferase family 1 protein [Solirubrobacteraceae bacterium]|jgi:glycosyltransferase involved in cell wall biosynthesis
MLAALAEGFPADEWLAFVPRGPGSIEAARGAAPAAAVDVVRHRLPSRALFGSAALLGRPRLDRLVGGCDVVWIPAPAPVAVSRGTPYVLTVHDLSWLDRPQDFTRYERAWHRLGRLERLATEARAIVAVSHATRRAIERHWPSVRHVEVVHSGIPPLPDPGPRPPWLPPRYFLAVGALEPRKAPEVLARAFAKARETGLDAELVFAGRGRLSDAVRGPGVHVVEDADGATLAALYTHALALALPSHAEGFAFTALEAARAGTPVLASEALEVLDETLPGATLKVRDWPEALLRIAADDDLRERLAETARAQAARLSWSEAAKRLRDVLAR